MIEVFVTKENGVISEVECKFTKSEIAEDYAVASAVVTIVQTTVLGLAQVACVPTDFSEKANRIMLKVSNGSDKEQDKLAQAILMTMLCGVVDLQETFSDFLKLEVN